MHTRKLDSRLFVHLFFILFSLLFVLPFLLVIAISISRETDVVEHGYKLIPREIDFTAYRIVFRNTSEMTRAYGVTAFQSIVTMALSLTIMSMCAYSLARRSFALRKPITFFIFFTMLFGGGLIPSYILNTQYLHIGNTIWIYILPSLANAFYIIIFRTFFQGLPDGLIESAKIDGAGELRVYWQIVVPLSKPVFATFALFVLLERWNDWFQSLIYVRDAKLYTLQFLLQKILLEAEFIRNMARDMPANLQNAGSTEMPSETVRFAMAIVAAGPLLIVFPFFQKHFAKGLTVGSIKG